MCHRRPCLVVAAAILALTIVALASPATALPRYSARYGQRCALCHVDPSGGGLRTTYASEMIVPDELAFQRYTPEQVERIHPEVSESITVGLDQRLLIDRAAGGVGNQIAMQGDLYVGVQMDPHFIATMTVGQSGTREYTGTAYVLPLEGYVKMGRFTPDYGWHFADHFQPSRRFLLDENGSPSPLTHTDTGVEVGVHTQMWEATTSLLQGLGGRTDESYTARIALRHSFGNVNGALGASMIRREVTGGHRIAHGGFGYLAAGPLSWVFEVDETGNGERNGILISQEYAWQLHQGLFLRGVYGYQDPDRRVQAGSRERWGVGVDLLATPFFGVTAMANRYVARRGTLVDEPNTWRGEIVLHVLY